MESGKLLRAVAVLIVLAGCEGAGMDWPDDAGPGEVGELGELGEDAGVALDAAVEPAPDLGDPTDAAAPSTPDANAPEPAPDASGGPSGPIERTFRFLTWNIAGGKENDCQTRGITRAVRRFVRDHDIDFVGLNEVCPAQHRAIREALRSEWGLGPRRHFAAYVGDEGGRIVGNGIYARLGLEDVTRHRVGEDRYGNRNLLCGRVPSLPHLRFCSTHLSPGDSKATVQMGRVLERIEGWWQNRRDTVVLSGDLNLQANHRGLDSVYSGAVDTRNNRNNRGRYREVDDDDPEHCRGFGERSTPRTSGGPCREGGKIDFIFVRQNRIAGGAYSGDTLNIPGDCTGVCSDHRPVKGRVRLTIRRD